jgi:dimethylhistidine N-methyltransferase
LLRRISPELVRLPPAGSALIEYGASDETKARLLLDAAGAQFAAYVPVDVAAEALDHIQIRLQRHAPTLAVHPLCADFTQDPVLPQAVGRMAKFGFFPGSTIGNLDPPAARRFLVDTRRTLGDGAWLVVGADLRKDEETLHAAYNDAAGVTAAFNLNMLKHLNRETGADFDLRRFAHVAIWNATESRIEMHLRSQTDQTVTVAGTRVDFRAGETIHTENSYKHSLAAFQALASHAGWHPAQVWTDPDSLFSVHALHAVAE